MDRNVPLITALVCAVINTMLSFITKSMFHLAFGMTTVVLVLFLMYLVKEDKI